MDWFGLFDKEVQEEFVPTVQNDVVNAELSGLNLAQVLAAHTAWKTRLTKIIYGSSDETPNIAVVSQDNQCFLGKWLHSEGKALYGHLPEYQSARQAHAEFHVCAGEVLEQHRLGYDDQAAVLLKTKFRSVSNKNQVLLTRLFVVAKS